MCVSIVNIFYEQPYQRFPLLRSQKITEKKNSCMCFIANIDYINHLIQTCEN